MFPSILASTNLHVFINSYYHNFYNHNWSNFPWPCLEYYCRFITSSFRSQKWILIEFGRCRTTLLHLVHYTRWNKCLPFLHLTQSHKISFSVTFFFVNHRSRQIMLLCKPLTFFQAKLQYALGEFNFLVFIFTNLVMAVSKVRVLMLHRGETSIFSLYISYNLLFMVKN